MKFMSVTGVEGTEDFSEDYGSAHALGKLRLGRQCLYFRSGFRIIYIPYGQITRYFRRVMQVPAKLCCGKGNFEVESLVICGAEGELAQIQMPGAKAGRAAVKELAALAPHAKVGPLRDGGDPDPDADRVDRADREETGRE